MNIHYVHGGIDAITSPCQCIKSSIADGTPAASRAKSKCNRPDVLSHQPRKSEERVDERSDSRGRGENEQQAEESQHHYHGHQPPQFTLPKEAQQLSYDTQIGCRATDEVFIGAPPPGQSALAEKIGHASRIGFYDPRLSLFLTTYPFT